MSEDEVANVNIEFTPVVEPGTVWPTSHATTEEKGHFTLTCDDKHSGAAVGKHKVVVRRGRNDPADTAPRTHTDNRPIPQPYTIAAADFRSLEDFGSLRCSAPKWRPAGLSI